MDDQPPFDDTTRCGDRVYDDVWKPYAFREHREERDRNFGETPDHMLLGQFDGPEYFIPRKRFYEAYRAVSFANYHGVALSSMLTINWEKCGWAGPDAVHRAYSTFAPRLRKFFTDKGHEARYLTVFENGSKMGLHSHTLVAVPFALRDNMKRWCRLAVRVDDPYSVREDECYRLDLETDDNVVAQWNRFRYLMKNLAPDLTAAELKQHGDTTACQLYDVGYWPHKQSDGVPIQRIRISGSLTTKAQKELGYRPLHDIRASAHPAPERYSDAELKRSKARDMREELIAALAELQRFR